MEYTEMAAYMNAYNSGIAGGEKVTFRMIRWIMEKTGMLTGEQLRVVREKVREGFSDTSNIPMPESTKDMNPEALEMLVTTFSKGMNDVSDHIFGFLQRRIDEAGVITESDVNSVQERVLRGMRGFDNFVGTVTEKMLKR